MATWTQASSRASAGGASANGASPLVSGFSPNCTLTSTTPTTSSCNHTTMTAGYNSTSKSITHALIEFEAPVYQDVTVLQSALYLYMSGSTTKTATPVGLYPVTSQWQAGATWNTTNGTTAWTTPGGDVSTGADAYIDPSVGASTGWVQWIPSQAMQEFLNTSATPNGEGRADYGFLVKQATDGSANNVLTFETPNEGERVPKIVTYWIPRGEGSGSQYTNLSISATGQEDVSVNPASGNLMLQNSDLHIAGRGLNFDAARTWNSLDSNQLRVDGYGMSDTNQTNLLNWEDGSVSFKTGSGAWFQFHKQGTSFATPAGLDATMCATGSPAPCPTSLPSGTAYRLLYNENQSFIDFAASKSGSQINYPIDYQDRYGNKITVGYKSGVEHETSWLDTEGRTIEGPTSTEELGGAHLFTGKIDISGGRSVKYHYGGTTSTPLMTSYTDAAGNITEYAYNGENEISEVTDPDGNVAKYSYDSSRRVTEVLRTTNGTHTKGSLTTFAYYQVGEAPAPCSSTQKATVVHDPDFNSKKPGHTTTYCANTLDEIESTIDANGNASEATYNSVGRTTSTTAAAPGTSESGNIASLRYDSSGLNLLCVVTGTSEGQSSCPSTPNKSALVTSFSYKDATNPFSPTQVKNPEASSVFGCYNGGHQEGSEGPACPGTATGPSGTLQNLNDQLAEQHEMSFAYNGNGSVSSSSDADGHTTTYEYDGKGNLSKIIPPAGSGIGGTVISVDADSRPHVITDGAGHVETITYDNDDRATEVAYSGTGSAVAVKFTYDGDGNLTKRVDPSGTTKYVVDALGRVTKETLPGSLSNKYGYDDASNMTSFADGGGTTKYVYNGVNELESMTEPGVTGATTFAYDADHRLTQISYPSGAKETYKLEPTTGRPEVVTPEGITGTAVGALTYSYKSGENDSSLVQQISDSTGSTTTYGYDALKRLRNAVTTGAAPAHYEYKLDGAGNRTQQTVNIAGSTGGETTYFAYNSGNELECRQTVATPCSKNASTELSGYSFDAAGEDTAITPRLDASGSTFAYNAASQLSAITPAGSSEMALSYGGAGQDDLLRVGSGTSIQNSLLGVTREVGPSGTSYFARTPTGLLIDQRTPSGNFNPLYDGQGDVVALVAASAKVERNFRYGPYGENVKSEGTQTVPNPFGFKSGYRLPGGNTGKGNVANGLYHFGQRVYDPTTGTWTQQDPRDSLRSPIQADRFGFAGADPINMSDPSGEDIIDEGEEWIEENEELLCNVSGGGAGILAGVAAAGVTDNAYVGGAAGALTDRYVTEECEEE